MLVLRFVIGKDCSLSEAEVAGALLFINAFTASALR